ncbi:MAG TPA: phospholipase D-like domain-containing protein [Afipia sp.]
MPGKFNLNELQPENDGNYPDTAAVDNSSSSNDGSVKVYFRDLVKHLKTHINDADAVFGCVAWLTHVEVLDVLAKKHVAIVVQKEDFLRPDFGAPNAWKRTLRQKYDALSCGIIRYDFDNMIGQLSTGGDPTVEAIRCVGNYNRDKAPAFPRMHNKFLIFARVEEKDGSYFPAPYAVWTGSFNLTANATYSLENALYITKPELVAAYFNEFGQIMAISEPLDWQSDWCEPELRIGT